MISHSVSQRLSLCLGLDDRTQHAHDANHADANHFHPVLPKIEEDYVSRANELVQQVARLYEVIRASTADQERSAAIGELIRCLHRQWPLVAVQHVLDDQRITSIQPALWRVLSDVECKAEASGARELLQRSSLSLHDVLAFRHGGDYEPLIARELRCLFEAAPHLQGKSFRCTFIGSGPVPLSAILIHKHTTATVQCIDIDPVATELAASLLGRLGLSHAIVARCSLTCDATILQCIENTEVVFVASLVQDKAQILRQLKAGVRPPRALLHVNVLTLHTDHRRRALCRWLVQHPL